MPKIDFLGKGEVYNHHMSVPYRSLEADAKKSVGKADMDGNLIIKGDNLYALKALLPRYAGKVKCIYIDPPYNTGNEGWKYNDKLNSPTIKEWFAKSVDREDQTRHDKWLCMMWPRLQLLKELLSEDGAIFISIDDNEQHHLRAIMDEMFGEKNIDCFIWHKSGEGRYGKMKNIKTFRKDHEYIMVAYKGSRILNRLWDFPTFQHDYGNPDNDLRGPYKAGSISIKEEASNPNHSNYYSVTSPTGKKFKRQFDISESDFKKLDFDKRIYWGKSGDAVPAQKIFIGERRYSITSSLLRKGSTYEGTKELEEIFSPEDIGAKSIRPKPSSLVFLLAQIATGKDSIILDSFAGSGTTAQAVLELNKQDGGNRKFILVECEEEIADTITTERIRRVVKGVKDAKDENLREGLGGSFTYCTLGEEIDIPKMLSGESLPSWEALARYVFWLGTGTPLAGEIKEKATRFIGEYGHDRVYLIYKPDLAFMRSDAACIKENLVEKIRKEGKRGTRFIIYAAGAYISQRDLQKMGITFCQLPYALTERIAGFSS